MLSLQLYQSCATAAAAAAATTVSILSQETGYKCIVSLPHLDTCAFPGYRQQKKKNIMGDKRIGSKQTLGEVRSGWECILGRGDV